MIDPVLTLVVCSNYRAEVEAIIRSEGWQDVRLETFNRMCGCPQQKIPPTRESLKKLLGKFDVAVINCQRMQPELAADNFYQLPQCFDMIVNQSLVDYALRHGRYILTPNWLAHWSEHLSAWGFDQPTARQFFKESMTGLLLLDTGLDEQSSRHLAAMSAYLDMRADTYPVGLDTMRLYLTHIVSAWRHKKALEKIEALNREASRATADYAMVIDLLTRLTQVHSEEEVHSEIADLFTMLFSVGHVVYYPLEDGHLLQTQTHSLDDDELLNLQAWLKDTSEPYTYVAGGTGFYLRIEYQGQPLGLLVADQLTLPQYRKQYLNLSLMIASLCGLSIANARNYQKLQQAEAAARKEREIAETLRLTMTELASELSLDDLIKRILVSLSRVIPFSESQVYLKQGDSLVFKSGLKAKPDGTYQLQRPTEKYLQIDAPWLKSDPMTLEDVHRMPELRAHINPQVVQSWIGLPLLQHGEIIGLLSIANFEKNLYNQETLVLAQAFGGEVSIALENARLFTEANEAAITDSLTGLVNRRRFYELAVSEFVRSRRYNRPLSAVMMDIDFFKKVNDTYGHLAGDQVLREFARLCAQNVRGVDIIGRYGGEEFAALLPETDLENAAFLAERLRKTISEALIPTGKGMLSITCSLGVSAITPECQNVEQLLDQCDQALYKAKQGGRNRVCCWEMPLCEAGSE